jgi:alkyl hydroperoxide reductase subunit AhpC
MFIIDGKKNLRKIKLNDINVGRYVDENISIVKELKLKDVNGEV